MNLVIFVLVMNDTEVELKVSCRLLVKSKGEVMLCEEHCCDNIIISKYNA